MGRAVHRASASSSASSSASIITLNLGVGCAPSCWPIFGFRNLLGARRGAEGSFLCSLITDFLAEGAGWGSLPRAWRRVGVPARGTHDGKFLAKTTRKYISVLTEMPEIPKILPAAIKNPRSPKILHLTGSWRHI